MEDNIKDIDNKKYNFSKIPPKTLVLILSLIILSALFFIYKPRQNQETAPAPTNKIITLPPPPKPIVLKPEYNSLSALPEAFPQDIILDKKATTTSNVALKDKDSGETKQYTLKFETQMSPKELCGLYREYFKKNGWVLDSAQTNTNNLVSANASKDNKKLYVLCGINSSTKKNFLDLTLVLK